MATALIVGSDPTAGHNYLEALEELIASGALADLPQGAFVLEIIHGDGCPIFDGGRCDCDPELMLKEAP